ncbi:MAG: hypothetical protein WBA77_19065 [Microcoleaceae cyanobacterium]
MTKQPQKAISTFVQLLQIVQNMGDGNLEVNALILLGSTYSTISEHHQAI